MVLIIFGSFGLLTIKILYDFFYRYFYNIVNENTKKLIAGTQKYLRVKSPEKRAVKLKAALPSLLPVLLSGPLLFCLSYALNPERLRELVALLADAIVILAHELGRVLLQLIPPQLHDLAQRIGA